MGDEGRGGGGWHDTGWGFMHDGMGWGGWLLLVLLLLLLAGLVVGVVIMLTTTRGPGPAGSTGEVRPQPPGSSAEQVLDERFARGEIDEEEYLRRRAVLRGG